MAKPRRTKCPVLFVVARRSDREEKKSENDEPIRIPIASVIPINGSFLFRQNLLLTDLLRGHSGLIGLLGQIYFSNPHSR